MRIRRNCSDDKEFKKNALELTTRLKARGYPKKIISKAYMRAKNANREDILKPKYRIPEKKTRLITTYNNQWQDIYRILGRNWNILLTEPKLESYIDATPTITSRKARNLKDILVKSHFKRQGDSTGGKKLTGSFACGNCNICQYMLPSNEFEDPIDGKRHHLKHYINCRTRNVVYAITCSCPKVYIGQTSQELRKRIQKHLSTISTARRDIGKDRSLTSVASHFHHYHGGFLHQTRRSSFTICT
ncbi:uncharacterized protein [Engystomops pustulosus]|uniref:uncharacterized protein n=1 Tax=Engystomops pustulosus TaxID=76066 RepID=UPI003AFA9E66